MKKIWLLVMLMILVTLTACENIKLDNNSDKDIYLAPSFEVDNMTVRQNNEWNIKQEIQEEIDESTVKTEQDIKVDVGEIQLENTDTSVDYVIDGNDILYNNIRFKGLNNAINSVTTPYDTNTFINFIVKTYSTSEPDVLVNYNIDDGGDIVEEGIGESFTLHESLMADSVDYQIIYNKYGEKAYWQIILDSGKTEEFGMLYGCKSYVMYQGSGNLVIDMNEFDSGTLESVSDTQIEDIVEPVESEVNNEEN